MHSTGASLLCTWRIIAARFQNETLDHINTLLSLKHPVMLGIKMPMLSRY